MSGKRASGGQRRQNSRWLTVEDLRPHLDPLVQELGHMPNTTALKVRGRNDLISAIISFGGFESVAKEFGYAYTGPKTWMHVEDLRPHLDPIVQELGRMPTGPELKARYRVDLTGAIRKFGGYPQVADDLGYRSLPRNSWDTIEDLRPHLDPLVREFGCMPTQAILNARGMSSLNHAIKKFGGPGYVAQVLGYRHKERNYYETVEDLRPHLQPFIDELGAMPSQVELKARGRYDLTGIIHRFGGQRKVALVLGYPYQRKQWKQVEDLRPYLDPIVGKLEHMPSQQELEQRGRADLRGAIERFGGPYAVADALGYPYGRRNWWRDVEDLRPYLDPIVQELGRMPTQAELRARNAAFLINACKKFGNPARVAEALGYPLIDVGQRERLLRARQLEEALNSLHQAQQLSVGQIMLILRHAGILSRQALLRVTRQLYPNFVDQETDLSLEEEILQETFAAFDEDEGGMDASDETADPDGVDLSGASSTNASVEDSGEEANPSRHRSAEIKELRGWSAVGNLLDPTPALVQLSVNRLKTAFYQFARAQQGALDSLVHQPSIEKREELTSLLWQAAFGTYQDLLSNELIQEACRTYIADLVGAFLLPRVATSQVPRLYQLDGARFLAERLRSETQPYGLLFDQPGMGKTLTVLLALAAAGVQRWIVVAPLTVKTRVWTLESVQMVFPSLTPACVARTLDEALALPRHGAAIVFLHYEELRRHEALRRLVEISSEDHVPFDAVIFDEAHTVKERLSTVSTAQRIGAQILQVGSYASLGLTATPVVNELYEPVSLLHLVQGRQQEAESRRLQSKKLRDRVDVMEYLLAHSLRRLKADVLQEIPPRHLQVFPIIPTASQLERIQQFLNRGRHAVAKSLTDYRRLMVECKIAWLLDRVGVFQEATTPDGAPDAKMLVLCCNVEGVSDLVFSHLLEVMGAGRVAHICGRTSQQERESIIEQFLLPGVQGCQILVGTLGTIGVGVTLFHPEISPTPHRVIVVDLPYTWAEFEQGIDRLHRVGQRFPVEVCVPVVTYPASITDTYAARVQSFDEWVWAWINRKRLLADQVIDADFDIAGYKDSAIRKAISSALKALEHSGGAVIAPPPPPDSAAARHRRLLGRYRCLPRQQVATQFRDPEASLAFLAYNDQLPAARLAQQLVRERLGRWLDSRSVVVDLGCGSHPLRDLPCVQVIGIDRHGANGSCIGDSAETGLPAGIADFVVFSLSLWGTPADLLCYFFEAKRLLRPIGKLIIVEPMHSFGEAATWEQGVHRLRRVLERLGMHDVAVSTYILDSGSQLIAITAHNSTCGAAYQMTPDECVWHDNRS